MHTLAKEKKPHGWKAGPALHGFGNQPARRKGGYQVPGVRCRKTREWGTGYRGQPRRAEIRSQKTAGRRQERDDFGFWIEDFGFGGVPKSRRQEAKAEC